MPNWCSVSVSVSGPTENVQRMFDELTALQSVKREKQDVSVATLSGDADWLGHVVRDIFGIEPDSPYSPQCRGYFVYLREDIGDEGKGHASWFFTYKSAWGPAVNFNIMLRKHYAVNLVWESEEPGMDEYLTSEPMECPYFSKIENYDYEFYKSEKEMLDDTISFIHEEFDADAVILSMVDAARYLQEMQGLSCKYGRYLLFDDSDYLLPMHQH